MNFISKEAKNGNMQAQAIVSSCIETQFGKCAYDLSDAPWCSGYYCVSFVMNSSPKLPGGLYNVSKATWNWNDQVRSAYNEFPLSGEYFDSFCTGGNNIDLNEDHFVAAQTPLSYQTNTWKLGMVEMFNSVDFGTWVTNDLHNNLKKLSMANIVPRNFSWGSNLFDYLGQEVNIKPSTDDGEQTGFYSISPFSNQQRTLSYQKPYGYLADATVIGPNDKNIVKYYFDYCLFYAIYPSFESGWNGKVYWADPIQYERDREFYKTYVPLMRTLNDAKWYPKTHFIPCNPSKKSSPSSLPSPFRLNFNCDSSIYQVIQIERYGIWPQLYFTLRNIGPNSMVFDILVQVKDLQIPEKLNLQAHQMLSYVNQTTYDLVYLTPEQALIPNVLISANQVQMFAIQVKK